MGTPLKPIPYSALFETPSALPSDEILAAARATARERLKRSGFPNLKTEDWKYLDVAEFVGAAYDLGPRQPHKLSQYLRERLDETDAMPVHWINQYQIDLCATRACSGGISVAWMSRAPENLRRAAEKSLLDTGESASDAFRMANAALVEDVLIVSVDDGAVLPKPVHVSQVMAGLAAPSAVHRRVVLLAGKGSRASVILDVSGDEGAASLVNLVFDARIGEGAKLKLAVNHRGGSASRHLVSSRITLAESALLQASIHAHTGKLVRTDLDVLLAGRHSRAELTGLSVLSGESRIHHRVTVRHEAPECASDQLFKAILAGSSRYEYTGRVEVGRGAVKTESKQLNRNLVLSDNATAYVRPQLRILNDDVKCSHGSSTGQLEPDEVFYLESRGLDEASSRTLLAFGFAEEMIGRVPVEEFRTLAERDTLAALKSANV
jgi:Fe-S cluster assembly protein SufD